MIREMTWQMNARPIWRLNRGVNWRPAWRTDRRVDRRTTAFRLMTLAMGLAGWMNSAAQGSDLSSRKFVRFEDSTEFTTAKPAADGFSRSYETDAVQIYDLDTDSTTYMMKRQQVLLCEEGQLKNRKREGVFSFYVIDAADHSKRYKVWEKTFVAGKLSGEWRTYSLRGGIVRLETYKNDSLNGVSRTYWIDGKGIMDEREYLNGRSRYIQRIFYKNGKPEAETGYANGIPDGVSRHYYPNGQLETDEIIRSGKEWEIRGSYTENGVRRKGGTLRGGNGTVVIYNEDGSVKGTKTFVKGVAKT
jgi:hypothetical protein